MQRILTSLALFLALGMGADRATALGFGRVSSATSLGQPLSFAIALRLDPNENLEAKCIKAEVSLGDRVLAEALVRARLETAANTGERRVRITTTVPVDEPVVSIQLHVGCPPSLSRSFMVFADPPLRAAASSGSEAAEGDWVPDRAESPVSAVLSAIPAAGPAASAPVQARRSRPSRSLDSPGRTEVASAAREAAPATASSPRARVRAPAKPRSGPVLRLDPVEADALILPSLQMATSLSQAPDPAASGVVPRFVDPEQEQRLREQERLKAMEAALLKLRSDSEATHKALGEMQLRVRAAEASRYANPLVYLLVALCVLLAAGLAGMFWLRRRDRRSAAWWTPPVEASPPAMVAEDVWVPPVAAPAAPEPMPLREALVSAPMPMPPPAPVSVSVSVPSGSGDLDAAVVEPRRPMSAEELIDLEQQAEFFVVLGQDDAAIDLLMGHVRSTGGVSPLPYLKLLEIYRRRGEREPYDRIRERFNRRFNAYAPEWDVDPELGLSLEGYPEVMSRLQKAWATPSQAMDLLDASLFRRDAGPTFDVPAYRELLFLYGMSRDLAERDTSPEGVDLLLPLNDEPASTLTSVPASSDHFSIDLDVSTDQPPHLTLEDPDFKRNER